MAAFTSSLKSNKPKGSNGLKESPYDRANVFSIYALSYMLPLFRKSKRQFITADDIGPPPRVDMSRTLGLRLQQAYNQQILNEREPSLVRCLLRVFGPQLFLLSLLDFCSKCIAYPMQTVALGWLIRDCGIYLNLANPLTVTPLPPLEPSLANLTSLQTPADATLVGVGAGAATSDNLPAPSVAPAAAQGLTNDEAYWRIVYDAIFLVGFQTLALVLGHPFFFQSYHIGMKCRIAACFLIYKKALRLSQSAMSETTVGQMVNLLSNDVNRFDQVVQMLPYLIIAPAQALTVLAILSIFYLGAYPTLASLAAIVFYVIVQTWMGRGFSKYRSKTAKRTDERVRLMNEIILAMKIIKMYAWERPFKALVHAARKREITTIGVSYILRGVNQTLFFTSSKIIVFVALITYVLLGKPLRPEILFVTIGLANLVRISLTLFFPNAIAYVAETMVSCKRINKFLQLPEIELAPANYKLTSDCLGCKHVIVMNKVYASWASSSSNAATASASMSPEARWAVIRNLTLAVRPRDLVLIVGRVGSGKSSVLMTMLGELPIASGRIDVNGRLAYASQEAWIFSGTVRDNILFGKDYEPERYREVIRVCSLARDLEILIDGDLTIVGERGVSLSGGQKARVNLARALYQDADIYLLDDPLSAVDAPVAKHIFNESLKSFLRKKTVVLATHQLQFLRHATKVLVVDRDSPAAFGTIEEVMKSEAFAVVDYSKEAFEDATTTEPGTDLERGGGGGGGSAEDRKARRARKTERGASFGAGAASGSSSASGSDSRSPVKREGQSRSPGRQDESAERLIRAESQASSNLAESVRQLSAGAPLAGASSRDSDKKRAALDIDDAPAQQKAMLKKYRGNDRRQGAELLSNISSNFSTYLYYLSNACGPLLFIWFVLTNVFAQTLYQLTDYFLSFWTDSVQRQEFQGANFVPVTFVDGLSLGQISGAYSLLIAVTFVAALVRAATFFAGTLRASVNIHEKFFNCIIHAPMTFFDFSPIGILLNRLSRDIGFVDETLPATAIEIVTIFVNIIGIVALAVLLDAKNLAAALILLLMAVYARTVCASTITRLKSIEGLTKSPIFSHLSTTLAGLPTIRAFRVQDEFVRIFDKHQDSHTSAWFCYISSGRWLAVTLDWICLTFISLVIAMLLAFSLDASSASFVGLLISQVVVLPGPFQWGMRQLIEVESQMTSVQRVKEFSELKTEDEIMAHADGASTSSHSKHESGSSSPGSRSGDSSKSGSPAPRDYKSELLASYQAGRVATPLDTPDEEGQVAFVNVSLSYFPDEPPVLKRLNFTVKPREKIGIVGRTGAGKSSIVSVLFRLYDFEGRIKLDGRDTKAMRLRDVRRAMSIIPQDPILFGGTIRKNLDPFGEYADAQLWDALEAVHLKAVFARHPQGLEFAITEGGSNFSVGQRQLICLARAIVRRNKVLVLDEATANVDPETDAFIQRTISRQFAACTVLTIAHRLITIVESDRVLVLDRGEVSEFGDPHDLLQNRQGIFAQMVTSSAQQAPRIVKLIEEAHRRKRQPSPDSKASDTII